MSPVRPSADPRFARALSPTVNPEQNSAHKATAHDEPIATDLFHGFEGVPKLVVHLVELCLADVQQLLAAFLLPDVDPVGYEGQYTSIHEQRENVGAKDMR